jgi:excisionase family DNA binding protein
VDHADSPSCGGGTLRGVAPRFLLLADVAEVLNISAAQTYALVRSGDLKAIKIGRRGQWRVEASELEAYIAQSYKDTEDYVQEHPFGSDSEDSET